MVGGFIRKFLETRAEDLRISYDVIPKGGDSLIRKRGRIDWGGGGFLVGLQEGTSPLRARTRSGIRKADFRPSRKNIQHVF